MRTRERSQGSRAGLYLALGLIGAGLWWVWPKTPGAAPQRDEAGSDGAVQAIAGAPRSRLEAVVDPLRLARAAVSGTVTDVQGRPIAGAQVCARTGAPELASSETRKARCVQAGRDGRYRVDDLLGVRYSLSASAAGHIPAQYEVGEGAGRRTWVQLRPADEATGVDIELEAGGVEVRGVVKDLSGGAIEGAQVAVDYGVALSDEDGAFAMWVRPGPTWASARADGYASGFTEGVAPGHLFEIFLTPESVLVGKVVRVADGTPVEGARVTAQSGGWGWNDASAISDAGGNFRLDGLEPGAYKAQAVADDATGMAEEQAILGLGETSAQIVIQAHPAFSAEGRVVVAGAAGCDEGSVALRDDANARGAHAELEADGRFHLRGLLPGEHQVQVRCAGHVSAERYPRVTIADSSVKELRYEVTAGRAIRGVVVDDRGQGVAKIRVNATAKPDPSKPRAQQTSAWAGETDAQGRFVLAGLLPGDYDVGLSTWPRARALPDKPHAVKLPAGADLEGVRIELPATGEVRGKVRDADGRPVAKASVSLYDGKRGLSTSAGDDGSFRFEHVAPGSYRATARRGWDRMRAPGTKDDDLQGEKVEVSRGSSEAVTLVVEGASATISGVVVDEDGGAVADAFIEATREPDSATAAAGSAARYGRWGSFFEPPRLTDTDGRFKLERLPPGKHTLRAHRKGGGEALLEHVESGSGDVVLTIAATGRMSGTVALRGGSPPESFTVAVEDEATGFERSDTFFRTGGAWSLAELPAGKFKVRVSAGAGSAEVDAHMVAGQETAGVRVELTPKVTVRGKIVDLEGKPVPGLNVNVTAEGGMSFDGGGGDEDRRNITDDAGEFEVDHAPTGKVTLAISPRNWSTGEFDYVWVPAVIAASESAVVLPPIRVARKRVARGETSGDLGYSIKQPEAGADPLARRLVVAVVRPGSPAAAAGLQVGDEIVTVDGHSVTGPDAYMLRSLTNVPPGAAIVLGLKRGASVTLTAGDPP